MGLREGYLDFMLPERPGEPIPLKLKPQFLCVEADRLRHADADPGHHLAQVRQYLRDREYLGLSDLRTAPGFLDPRFLFEDRRVHSLVLEDKAGGPPGSAGLSSNSRRATPPI